MHQLLVGARCCDVASDLSCPESRSHEDCRRSTPEHSHLAAWQSTMTAIRITKVLAMHMLKDYRVSWCRVPDEPLEQSSQSGRGIRQCPEEDPCSCMGGNEAPPDLDAAWCLHGMLHAAGPLFC